MKMRMGVYRIGFQIENQAQAMRLEPSHKIGLRLVKDLGLVDWDGKTGLSFHIPDGFILQPNDYIAWMPVEAGD